jgi:hypothetical protein
MVRCHVDAFPKLEATPSLTGKMEGGYHKRLLAMGHYWLLLIVTQYMA